MLHVLLLAAAASAQQYILPEPPKESTGTVLRFTADHLDYDAETALLHLKGSAVIRESSRTIKADELWLDTRRRSGRAEGQLYVEDADGAVAGRGGGEFDFDAGTGKLRQSSAGYADWDIHAKEARLSGRNKLDYVGATFTSCDFHPPHYRFRASRVTVVPKDHLLARNVVFFLGPVPIMYTPFLYKSLKPEHWFRMKFQPGYDRRNGAYLKGTLYTQHRPWLYSKFYLDYYASQGPGTGLELQKRSGADRGNLLAYRVRENSSGTERWTVLGNAYEAVASSVALQARLQIQSDADFNNHYARSSSLRVTPELINSGAIVHRHRKATSRLSYSRQDVAAQDRVRFLKTTESYPRFDVQSRQFQVGRLPWLNTLTGYADNNYSSSRPFLQRSVGGQWEGTRTFNLFRGVSLTPRLALQQNWYDKIEIPADFRSTNTVQSVFIPRYTAQNTLRFATFAGDWDLSYLFTRRMKRDTFQDDAGAPDHGIESNLISLGDAYRPSRAILLKASSAYDFRVFRDRSVGFRERVQPIVGEAIYTPRPDLNLTLRNDYQLQDGERSFIANGVYGDEERSFFSFGAGYTAAHPNSYTADVAFAVANASNTWRLGAALRSEVGSAGGLRGMAADRYRLFEKEISIARAWHDFFGRLLLRFRPGGVREANVRVDLRFGPGKSRTTAGRRDWEGEWFPERASGAYDRP